MADSASERNAETATPATECQSPTAQPPPRASSRVVVSGAQCCDVPSLVGTPSRARHYVFTALAFHRCGDAVSLPLLGRAWKCNNPRPGSVGILL
jgi:hypothetical protein